MAINKKLINFKKQEEFDKRNEAGEILETSIVFIDDTKKIVTHGTEFDCSADWNTLKNKPIVQDEGDSETLVMSQKAVKDYVERYVQQALCNL